jgi:ferredoxin
MKVEFSPLGKNAESREDETLLDVARRAGVPLANSCGAIGICARCVVQIVSGEENLSPPTAIEREVAARRNLDPADRFACQAVVRGDCVVTARYWGSSR